MVDINLRVPAIEKLIDYGASGVGAIAGPLLAPWRASREGKARLTGAEYDAQIRQVQAGGDAGALTIIAQAQSEARAYLLHSDSEIRATLDITREDIAQSVEFQGRKRFANARAVLEAAAEELGDKEVNDHEPDPDWTARFFDCIQDVSHGDMQKIWARILAGEVETPGRTSLRTLAILRDLSQRDAQRFLRLMEYLISDYVLGLFAQQATNEPLDAYFIAVMDIGLAHSSMTVYPSIQLSQNGYYDREHNGHVLRIEGPPEFEINTMELEATVLTSSGRELAKFCRQEPNWEYLSCFARYLAKQGCSLKLAPIIAINPDGRMQFSLTELRNL